MTNRKGSGGRGGHAFVDGEDSTAEGGPGGDGVLHDGGAGGDAIVEADRSRSNGGRGGRGGVRPGGRGGDARVVRDAESLGRLLRDEDGIAANEPVFRPSDTWVAIDGKIILLARGGQNGDEGGRGGDAYAVGSDSLVVGGQGGEASQSGGRGGRGGRARVPDDLREQTNPLSRAHMRWPYYEPITEPGRGGDAPDTPQYKARRLIVEGIKKRYFSLRGLPLDQAWWDREVVPLPSINEQLEVNGHKWRVAVLDDEYEFTDIGG